MTNGFYADKLYRAKAAMESASLSIHAAVTWCTMAGETMREVGRETQAAALEMICASLQQSQNDLVRWRALVGKTRENGGNGGDT